MFSGVTAACVCVLLVWTGCAMGQTISPAADNLPPGMSQVMRDLDQIATQAAQNPNDTGYTLGVVTRDGLAWTKSYGYADSGRRAPATSDTAYGIGCGAFTAIMLLQLTHEGRVHFSDPTATA